MISVEFYVGIFFEVVEESENPRNLFVGYENVVVFETFCDRNIVVQNFEYEILKVED